MRISRWVVALGIVTVCALPYLCNISAQTPSKSDFKDYSKEPYVLLQVLNKIKFENDGTYNLETHVRVRVQSASGVQDWGLIRVPYASSIGDAEIANVKVTKPDGTVIRSLTSHLDLTCSPKSAQT